MRLTLFFFFAIFFLFGNAQNNALILEDTEVIRCEVINDSGDAVLILMADTTFVRISKEQIYAIVQDVGTLTDRQLVRVNYRPTKGMSFRVIVAPVMGWRYSPGSNGFNFAGFTAVPALQISNWITIGVGTGIRFSNPKRIYPLGIDLRISGIKRIAPILVLGAGKAFSDDPGVGQMGDIRYGSLGIQIKNLRGGSVAILFGLDEMPRYNSLQSRGTAFMFAPELILQTYSYTFSVAMRI
ncbi:hypothetical protein O3Q51_07275 [Cryomorphaceae bacterium 1068]|nr:hypothetical protein [Cryomorphaceae bacterium 1068]